MGLTKLLPDQIMRFWPEVKECIAAALPAYIQEDANVMLNIQAQLLLGSLECWIGCDKHEPSLMYGIVTTRFVYDESTGEKNLLIFTTTATEQISRKQWEDDMENMRKYAAAKECAYIIAYSNNPIMIHIAEQLGADTSYRMLLFTV